MLSSAATGLLVTDWGRRRDRDRIAPPSSLSRVPAYLSLVSHREMGRSRSTGRSRDMSEVPRSARIRAHLPTYDRSQEAKASSCERVMFTRLP